MVNMKYQNPDGTFKEMTCPDNPDHKSKFCGCVRYMMEVEGRSLQSAKKICADIARKKGVIKSKSGDLIQCGIFNIESDKKE